MEYALCKRPVGVVECPRFGSSTSGPDSWGLRILFSSLCRSDIVNKLLHP